jgi:hypothetical protein
VVIMALTPAEEDLESNPEGTDWCLIMALALIGVLCAARIVVGLIRGEPVDGAVTVLFLFGGAALALDAALALHALQAARKRRG